jgi:fumarate reductase subunit C
MAARPGYVRPMAGWWKRNPFFLRYMAREATALFVAAYALVLLAGVVALASGPAAFEAWSGLLRTPAAIAFHAVLLAAFAGHTWSWFSIMPKTLPVLRIAGKRVPAWAITAAGLLATTACSVLIVVAGLALPS